MPVAPSTTSSRPPSPPAPGLPTSSGVEADRVAVYQIQDALVDLTDLGYADVKDNFSDGVLEGLDHR